MSTAVWKDIAQALKELDEIYGSSPAGLGENEKLGLVTRIVRTLHDAVESSPFHTTLLSLFQSSKGLGAMCIDYLKDRSASYIIGRENFYREFVGLLESIIHNNSMRPLMMYILKVENSKAISCSTMLSGVTDHLMHYKKVRWHVDPKVKSSEHASTDENPETTVLKRSREDVIEAILRMEIALYGAASLQLSSVKMYSLDQIKNTDGHKVQLPIVQKLHAARLRMTAQGLA